MSPRLWIALPVAFHVAAAVLMLWRVEPFYTFFYPLAWWSYILAISAFNSARAGNSLLFDDRPTLVRMALLSVPVWLLFEAFNFRLQNWSYYGVPAEPLLRVPGYPIAFATVLPGLFETRTLLENLGFPSSGRGGRLRVTGGVLLRFALLGILMIAAPLLWPHLYFPLVWVGLILILDPILYRWRDAGSLLAAAEQGDYRETVRLLAAGLLCGFLWEMWNFWAGAKWIYSIPYFEFLHVFEMPLLGYLGFAVFALECWLIWRFAERLWGSWSAGRRVIVTLAAVLFSIAVIYGIEQQTIVSYKELW